MMEDRLFPKSEDEVIFEKVEFFFLPDRTRDLIKNILHGKVSEKSLVCCHSGCDVCYETIYNCYVAVKEELGKK